MRSNTSGVKTTAVDADVKPEKRNRLMSWSAKYAVVVRPSSQSLLRSNSAQARLQLQPACPATCRKISDIPVQNMSLCVLDQSSSGILLQRTDMPLEPQLTYPHA